MGIGDQEQGSEVVQRRKFFRDKMKCPEDQIRSNGGYD